MLPAATSTRWRPLRSGLINLFKYENEVFRFEDGKLLLRGNNGSGKSRVLALQLPFLLDGEISPHRVEPDGDPAKRMEWNLLMGGKHDNRLGYTWIEFGRVDEEGNAYFLTLACGLHARKHGDMKRWFIVTPLRVGEGLQLLSEQQLPLTRERLEAALAGHGQVYQRARDYRKAVDDALFQLGPRYEPLIELLIRLRQPQLSRKLDAALLSNALSEALPPLSVSLIEDVAASFRGIEEDRDEMHDYRIAQDSVSEFLKTYRTYAAIVVRRQAEDVRKEHSQYEQRAREMKRFNEEREDLITKLEQSKIQSERSDKSLTAHRATERALRDSPEMKSVETLRLARERRDDRQRTAAAAKQNEQHAADTHARCRTEHETAAQTADVRVQESIESLTQFQGAGVLADFEVGSEPFRDDFESKCQRREDAMKHVRERNLALAEAVQRRLDADRDLERCRKELEMNEESASDARKTLEDAVQEFVSTAIAWESAAEELKLTQEVDWRATINAWLENRQAVFPFERAIREAHGTNQAMLISERAGQTERRKRQQEALRVINGEWQSLKEGRQPEPIPPHTRAPDLRQARPGAPLWQLCDFREDISSTDRAGYEAALEASGILDAWVSPEGSLADAASGDVFLLNSNQKVLGGTLNDVLRVESDLVSRNLVESILTQIGIENAGHGTWVSSSGHWRNGPLKGDWTKPEAAFLGFTARENARRRRMAELEDQRHEAQQRLDEIISLIEILSKRLDTLDKERDNAPESAVIVDAAAALDAAFRILTDSQLHVNEAAKQATAARGVWESRRADRDRDAGDLGLTEWREPADLEELRDLMAKLRQRAAEYWQSARAAAEAKATLSSVTERLTESLKRLVELREALADVERRHTEAAAEYDTLKDTHGQTADEVLARLSATLNAIERFEQELRHWQSDVSKTDGDIRVKDEQIRTAEEQRLVRQETRDHAVERFYSLVIHEFIGEASPELQPKDRAWSTARAVELARRAEQTLRVTDAEPEALSKAQTNLQAQLSVLNDQLGMRGYHPRAEAIEDGPFLVKCPFQGQDRTMSSLHVLLGEEVEQRSRMLDERERAVIENHLIGEVAKELQERIREGEDWVRDVNSELEKRPTSSGIKLKFVWRIDPDGPPGLAEANQQLLRMAATWSPAERNAIGNFLQDRIRAERADNEEGSWQEHLARALDYRSWRRFDVERWQDGKWQRLTKRTYGTGSGGEKAMTLTVPQFAAAAAHYRSASDIAPRLILLDEVFVGIDAETRAKLMGLLDTFDLDYVMTSEREWGCFPSVPSLAIYQLASRPDVPAVHVTRWVWNGKNLAKDG